MKAVVFSAAVFAAFTCTAQIAFAQTVMSNEPPRGQLGAGQSVWVACGPGKARKVTGGSNMRTNSHGEAVSANGGSPRQRGPCVAMKY
jgi:hypothetical protein